MPELSPRWRVGLAVGAFALVAGTQVSFNNVRGAGLVLDARSGAPVAHAAVRVDCERHRLLRGAASSAVFTLHTDATGRFHYTLLDTWPCDRLHLHPEKAGFVETASLDSGYASIDSAHIPERLYLTASADARMQRLEYEHRKMQVRFTASPPPAGWRYQRAFAAFQQSKRIAQTAAEQEFVRAHYCKLLTTLHDGFAPADISYLAKRDVDGGDHAAQVAAFCSAAAAAAGNRGRNASDG